MTRRRRVAAVTAGQYHANMSFADTIFIFFAALLLFGPKKLPEIARQVGKALNEFKRASNEFRSQIQSEISQLERENARKEREKTEKEQADQTMASNQLMTPVEPPPGTVAAGAMAALPAVVETDSAEKAPHA